MSLKIYYGSRIEDLAAELKERLRKERAAGDPFVFSQVVVPNANIAKWLQIKMFADTPELSMGIEFPFIEQRLFNLLGACFEPAERPRLMPMNAYANAIMSILIKDGDLRLQPFRRYVTGKDTESFTIDSRSKARMAWQLAVKLADLMDQYEVRREGVIARWLDATASKSLTDPTEIAEAALAQKLFRKGGVFPTDGDALSLRQLFERAQAQCGKPVGEKQSIYLFGISTLSSLQVKILYWLAKTHDVVVFHNNVCLEYWGDIETKAERIKNRLKGIQEDEDVRFDGEYDNRLLQQWGRAGRETLRLLVDLEEANGNEPEPIEFEWTEIQRSDAADDCTSGSMLAKVQGSIRHRVSEVGRVGAQDASIQIVGAPGVRREVEMVYNAILGAVWKPEGSGDRPWSDCTFSDIAVLVPDMATYRPVIEAVFDARGQIPYGLIDTSASDSSVYLSGFNALMTLAREGLSRETVFGVLDNACVQNALGFTAADVREWRRLAGKIGAFDGFEGAEHWQNVSWNRALSRLRLGMVANERPELPVCQDGDDSALKFSEIVEMLYRELTPLANKCMYCTPAVVPMDAPEQERRNWADSLRRIAGEFLAVGRDEPLEETVRRQLFQTLYALDKVEGRQRLDFVVEAVEEFVGGIKCQKGGYLTHGVTIAGLQPMRPVPFKQVFVLGMGEGLFPGRDSDTTLEIRGARRRLGDTKPSEVKKYLFLETLMATRERLVVSYPCHDIVKDAELFPSGMVCELKSFVEANILPEGRPPQDEKFKEVKLPLLERGEPGKAFEENPVAPITWSKEWFAGILPTYSNVERGIAKQIAARNETQQGATAEEPSKDRGNGNTTSNDGDDSKLPRQTITAKELAEFLESPLRAVLRRHHGISVEGYRDESIDPDAPLEIVSGPLLWEFQQKVLAAISDNPSTADIDRIYKSLADKGRVPEVGGVLGNYAQKKAETDLLEDIPNLVALKSFTKEFFPEGWEKPDPVRTPTSERDVKGDERGEMLYTGQTLGWVQSADRTTCHALVLKPCGDERGSGKIKETKFPPKAVLEPLVTWLMMVAGMTDERTYSLRVAIVDIKQLLYNAWNWSMTPEKAKKYIDGLADEYLAFLDTPDGDGLYLDYGYSDLAEAIVNAKKKNKIQGDVPASDEEWKTLAFSTDDYSYHKDNDFNNDLVIGETMKAWSRMPDERDVNVIKQRFKTMHKIPMTGTRDKSTSMENPAHNVEGA